MSQLTERTSLLSAPNASFPAGKALLALAIASAGVLAWQAVRPTPLVFAGLALDRLSALSGLFVAVVGGVVFRFASRSMEGHPERTRFLALLAFCVCMAFALSCAGNLAVLAVAWVLLGAGVHHLLLFGGGTPVAWRAIRRKFVVARLGDGALIAGLGLLAWRGGSLDIGDCLRVVPTLSHDALLPIAALLSIAAMARSVQVPFHAWLPETMDAPTPVSALLHAGIVNAGGILLIRFAPIVVRVPEACLMLSVVGTVTIVVGALAMSQQVRLKQSLAWSTIGQMGFMTVQCAVAAFPAALLHLLGHGAYKAKAFLGSGEAPTPVRAVGPAWWNLSLLASGTACAASLMPWASSVTGFDPTHSPGERALAFVVALAAGQACAASLGACGRRATAVVRGALAAVACCVMAPVVCFALYRGAALFLAPVLGELPVADGAVATLAAILPVIAITLLAAAHAAQPALDRSRAWRSMLVHARDGFHIGSMLDRSIDLLGQPTSPKEIRHA